MKNVVAKTALYLIEADRTKNRAYLTFTGYCADPSEMPNFLNDVKKATQGLGQGFTLLTDVTGMKTPSKEVAELHVQSQTLWVTSGLSKTAEIMPASAIAKMAVDQYSKTTGMDKKWFNNQADAEAWLDG